MSRLFFLLSILFLSVSLNSQNQKPDSLFKQIKGGKTDTIKAKARYALIDHYVHVTNQYTLGIAHCDTLIEFCKQKKFDRMQCKAWIYRAYCDEYLGNYDQAIHSDSMCLLVATKKDLKKEAANACQNMGNNFAHKGNYAKALEYFLGTLKIHEELKDSTSMATMYHNCAIVYRRNNQPQKSIEFLRKAASIREKRKDRALASTLCSIGNYFLENEKNNDSALIYYNKALMIAETYTIMQTIALVKENLGNLFMKKKDYKTAEKYFMDNLSIYEKMNEKEGIGYAYYSLANLYAEMGNKQKALDYSKKSLAIAQEIQNAEEIKSSYNTIAELSAMFKDYETAFKYRTLEMKMKDSLYSESGSKAMAEMSSKYESEKKQQEIKLLTEKGLNQDLALKNSKLLMYGVGIVAVLLIIVAVVLIRSNRNKNKTNTLLTHQKHVIEEKNKEITDSIKYAQRIQNAILPSVELIKSKLPESFIYYLPKDIVSGDIYYFQAIENASGNGELIIAAVDCTGHGVPGALVSVIGFNALNSAIKEFKITDPGKILDKTRELVVETFNVAGGLKDGMDMSLVTFLKTSNSELQTVRWSGANNPLWIVRKGATAVEEYKANKQPIGFTDSPLPFTTHEVKLNKGDTIYIFTDGYADQFGGGQGKKLKSGNMKKLLVDIKDLPMEKQRETILKSLRTGKVTWSKLTMFALSEFVFNGRCATS